MQPIYQNIICLIVGLVVGLKLSELYFTQYDYRQVQHSKFYLTRNQNQDDHFNIRKDQLYNKTRILCWILTAPKYHKKRAIFVKKTWGSRCNKLLFISSSSDDELETVQFNVSEGHNNLWLKTHEAFKYIYDHHFEDADWFLKADDDSYVIMENLREFLYPMSSNAPVYFGYKFQRSYVKQGYMSGSSYILSKEALRRFATKAYGNHTTCKYEYKAEDLQLGLCLEKIGVVAGDTRDALSRNRFQILSPILHLQMNGPQWFWKYQYYEQNVTDCCADSTISFHYVSGEYMLLLDFYLYRLGKYLAQSSTNTLSEKANMTMLLDKWRHDKPNNKTRIRNLHKSDILIKN